MSDPRPAITIETAEGRRQPWQHSMSPARRQEQEARLRGLYEQRLPAGPRAAGCTREGNPRCTSAPARIARED